ncbi:hypothetical protein [Leptothoe kymatousa]|uniref:hypothetical protein n=1 Tax=Leptothoe kymatousa TaxID=2651727 RepID=UPI001C03141C|nr:hypothetical protein [Leptothoe kymatousa]
MVDSSQESWPQLLHEHQPEANAFIKPLTFHADPLTPLRLRDELALDEVFDNGYHMEEVLSDIRARLGQLCPEPCWDDESFNFLRGYL